MGRLLLQAKVRVSNQGTGVAGRVGATLFFLVWLAIPTVMLGFVARDLWADGATWFWKETDCSVVESRVAEVGSAPDYAAVVRYTYSAGPLSAVESPIYAGTVVSRNYRGDGDYAKAQRLSLQYPAGGRARCYVNPSDPAQAVLRRNGLWQALVLPVPLLFIAIGAGGLWFTWRGRSTAVRVEPISSGATTSGRFGRRGGAVFAAVFFSVFFVVGAAVLVSLGGKAAGALHAGSWNAVEATVVSSRVRSHSGDSTTYSPDILYRYTVDDREYCSNRYDFMGGYGGSYARKKAVADRYPPGSHFTAYVNPADPTDAVIERRFTGEMLVLLVPLLFMAAGVAGAFFAIRAARRPAAGVAASNLPSTAATSASWRPAGRSGTPARGPAPLKPRQSPGLKLFAVGFAALFWNGIVAAFLFHVAGQWAEGRVDYCLTAFMVPFVIVGLVLLVAAGHAALALFNPRFAVTLEPAELLVGGTGQLRWSCTGRCDRIERLVVRLEGREEATYRRGTDTYTDKNVFFTADVLDTPRPLAIRSGTATVSLPAETMHSFAAPNNKVLWVLSLHAHIRAWPDVKDEYVLAVVPGVEPHGGGAAPRTPEVAWA